MKRFVLVCMIAASIMSYVYAGDDLDSDVSAFRKEVFKVCSQLQEGNAGINDAILTQIDQILQKWAAISLQYKNNPPKQYSNDPAWALYFDEAKDNFDLMRKNAASDNIKRAVQFCGMNCMLFVKIHKINNTVTLADKMFDLRSAIRMMVWMAQSGNWKGVDMQINQCDSLLKGLHVYAQKYNNDEVQDIVKK